MVRIFFASNRDVKHESSKSGNLFGDRFNADGPQCFRVGRAEVTLRGSDPKDDEAWSVGDSALYPETLDNVSAGGGKFRIGSAAMFEDLRRALKKEDKDVIVYLHGFANSFQNTLKRAAALQTLYASAEQDVIVVMFSWPSNGRVQPAWNYFSDREDAEASGIAMGRALARLGAFLEDLREADHRVILAARQQGRVPDPSELKQCVRRLHVLAHSMGNWALRHAVRKFVELNEGRTPRIFDGAFLMAADEDRDALEEPLKLKALESLANRVFVYHSANDVALTIADRTKGMPARLGSDGPRNLDTVSERVIAIDCRDVSKTTLAHGRHQYYRLRDEVIDDLRLTLRDAPQDNRPGRAAIRPGRSWRLKPGG